MFKKFRAQLPLLALATAVSASPSLAQSAPQPARSEGAGEEVVVTGYRLQNQLAVSQKRDSETTADFLVADEINRQPDYNIADAFRRAPGVFTIFDEDEGRYVAIRGLNPDFTIASLDGALIASSERGNRRVNLEAIPSSAVQRLEIFKSRTANLEGNAIGGTINLAPMSAFQHKGFYAAGSASIGYTSDQDVPGEGFGREGDNGPSYRGEFTLSNTFMNNTLGVVVSGAYLQRRRDQQRFSTGAFGPAVNGLPSASSALFQGYPNTIERFGGFGRLEWRPTPQWEVTGLVSRYTQEDRELRLGQQNTFRGVQTAVNPTTNAFPQGQALLRFNDFFIDKPLFTAQASAKWTPNEDHMFRAALSYSEATFAEPSNEITFTTANNRPELGGTYSFVDTAPVMTVNNPTFYTSGANYPFTNYVYYAQDNDDYVEEYAFDYSFNTERSDRGLGFDAGVQFRENRRDFDEQRSTFTLQPGAVLTAANFIRPETFRGPYANYDLTILDGGAFLTYFNANRALFREAIANIAADYFFDEDVTAAYAQGVFKADRFKVLAGLRWERTKTEVERPRTQGGVTSLVTRTGEYDHLLPSVTGYFDLTPQLRMRASYFRAIGRPNPIDLAGSESVTIGGDGVAQLSRGNPDLSAREADNFDLSLEYYLPRNQGLAAIAVFSKEIENEIFRFQSDETINGVLTRVTQPRNVAAASISGVELSLVLNNLGDFVAPLEGFGVNTNFTYFDGTADVVGVGNVVLRQSGQLLQQPETVFNASAFYKRGPFETRLTYARASAFPTAITAAATAADDREDNAYQQYDWTGRLSLNQKIQLTAEVRNISNEKRSNVQTAPAGDALRDYNIYGRTAFFGVAFKY